MKEEIKEVAEVMADYAGVEKGKILNDIKKQSIIGVIAVCGVMVIELLGIEYNNVVNQLYIYFQVLAYAIDTKQT